MKLSLRVLMIEITTVIALSLLLFFYGLGNFGLAGADEPRYAQIAREMLRNNDFVTPTLHGSPWLEEHCDRGRRRGGASPEPGVSKTAADCRGGVAGRGRAAPPAPPPPAPPARPPRARPPPRARAAAGRARARGLLALRPLLLRSRRHPR